MHIQTVVFSPTGGSRKIAAAFCERLRKEIGADVENIDITPPSARGARFTANGILVFAFPVYGGRVPAPLLHFLNALQGNGNFAIPVAVYGNRDYDDALLECADILSSRGFRLAGAGAFVAEHSYSDRVGGGRPDEKDLQIVEEFAASVSKNIFEGKAMTAAVKGNRPYKALSEHMRSKKLPPVPDGRCTSCGACARVCPTGIISPESPDAVGSGCIACNACVKVCPVSSRKIADPHVLSVRDILEASCTERKKAEYFV